MDLPDLLIALHAVKEGELDREDLPRLIGIYDTWRRGGLEVSCAELLTREFRIEPSRVRRWEEKLSGHSSRRIGKYQLKRRVGQGGMGIVFEAEHPNFDRSVAVKILSPALGRDPAAVQGFLREVKSAGRFNHPNIVHAFDAGIDGDLPFLVMEFVDGENLFQVLTGQGPLAAGPGARWLLEAARALSVLESQGWIHGDGKPSNWIVDSNGSLKLADLGLCRPPGTPREGETLYGSPPYVAPEHLAGNQRIDIRADLFSLGATFYHLFAGRPPFAARTVEELRSAIRKDPDPLHSIRPDLPKELCRCVHWLIERAPEDRPAGCEEFVEAVLALCRAHGFPVGKAGNPLGGQLPSTSRREQRSGGSVARWLGVGIGVVALLLVITVSRHFLGAGGGEPETSGSPSEHANIVAPATSGSHRPEDYQRLWEREPRDYRAIFAWLDEAEGHPNREEWSNEARLALDRDAAQVWRRLRAGVQDVLVPKHQYAASLEQLSAFPLRLNVGRFAAERQELVAQVKALRNQRLAAFALAMREHGVRGGALRMRALWQDVSQGPDAEWYQSRLLAETGGYSWQKTLEDAVQSTATDARTRRQELETALARGELPAETRTLPDENLQMELALQFLRRNPSLAHAGRRGTFRHELWRDGLLTKVSLPLLAGLCALLEEDSAARPPISREQEAATHMERARVACERWDETAAEDARGRIQSPRFSGTVAASALGAPQLDPVRRALRRGVFLRSGAFGAEVVGAWGAPPTFTYRFADRSPFREWSAQHSAWKTAGTGVSPKSALSPLKNIIPFEPGIEMTISLEPPPEPWRFFVTLAGTTVGFGRRTKGELLVVTGRLRDVESGLEQGAGFWPSGASAFGATKARCQVQLTPDRLVIRAGGGTLEFPVLTDLSVGWVELLVPPAMVIHEITLRGTPESTWLDRRRELWEQRGR